MKVFGQQKLIRLNVEREFIESEWIHLRDISGIFILCSIFHAQSYYVSSNFVWTYNVRKYYSWIYDDMTLFGPMIIGPTLFEPMMLIPMIFGPSMWGPLMYWPTMLENIKFGPTMFGPDIWTNFVWTYTMLWRTIFDLTFGPWYDGWVYDIWTTKLGPRNLNLWYFDLRCLDKFYRFVFFRERKYVVIFM